MLEINETARREFERAWRAGTPRPIEEFLPSESDPLYLPTLEELVYVDLEFSWKRWNAARSAEQHASPVAETLGPPSVLEHVQRFPALNEATILSRLFDQEAHCWAMFASSERPNPTSSHHSGSVIQLSAIGGDAPTLCADAAINRAEVEEAEPQDTVLQRRVCWLGHVPVLERLPSELLMQLAKEMTEHEYSSGELLVEQGAPCPGLVIVVQGSVSIVMQSEDANSSTDLRQLGPGTVLGELSLITGSPCTASVRAINDVVAWIVGADACQRLMDTSPNFANVCRRLGSKRLGQARIDAFCGKQIHNYRLIEVLGKGSMGIVYKASHVTDNHLVALKMLKPSMAFQPRVVARFRREADILRRLHHPHILQFIDEFEAAGTVFTAVEFCEGQSLDSVIKACGRLDLKPVKQIVGQLASALAASHRAGVIHRDLKPANVMIASSGQVKLADFGVALLRRHPALTRKAELLGTPRYMAPEQLLGESAVPATDVFALACITFEMLVGRPAQPGETLSAIMQALQQSNWPTPEMLSEIRDAEVRAFLAKALRRRPADRELDLGLLALWAH